MEVNSAISTTSINQNFPVQGTNNPSQGFRDNFAAIKASLNTAALEITELNTIVRNSLVSRRLDSYQWLNNDLDYHYLIRPTLINPATVYRNVGTVQGNYDINFNAAGFQKITLAGNSSFTITNFPKVDYVHTLRIWIVTTGSNYQVQFGLGFQLMAENAFAGRNLVFPRPGNYLVDFIGVGNEILVCPVNGFN